MIPKTWVTMSILPLYAGLFLSSQIITLGSDPASGVKFTDQNGKVRIEIDGKLFTEYVYLDTPRPYFYPVIGPGGAPMTRNWPMKEAPNEERDHPHHKSLWFTHGDVNGVDFWADGDKKGRIVHDGFVKMDPSTGTMKVKDKWIGPDGKLVCQDERTYQIKKEGQNFFIDFDILIKASEGDVTFGDTKEGSMGIRLAETMRLKGKVGKGHIINSAGIKDDQTWGKRAEWCDYYGPVQDQIVGVAMFDHPANPRHPTWWHVRDYGLFAANPFGIHDFEKKPAGAGDFKISQGQNARFRYRFLFHPGDCEQAKVADQYKAYISQTSN